MVDRLQTQLASRSIYDLNPSLLRLVPGQGHKHEQLATIFDQPAPSHIYAYKLGTASYQKNVYNFHELRTCSLYTNITSKMDLLHVFGDEGNSHMSQTSVICFKLLAPGALKD
jgi:hypothetical protein